MKKLLSSILALAMITSLFAISVHAAPAGSFDVSYVDEDGSAVDLKNLEAEDIFYVNVAFKGVNSMKTAALVLSWNDSIVVPVDKNGVSATSFTKVPTYVLHDDEEILDGNDEPVYTSMSANRKFTASSLKYEVFAATSESDYLVSGDVNYITFRLKVVAKGDAAIKAETSKIMEFDMEAAETVDINLPALTIGSTTPAKAELVEEDEEKGKGALETKEDGKKYYTQGFMATLTLNGQTVNAVNFKLKNKDVTIDSADNDKNVEGWSAPFEGEAPFVFAINVVNVPDGETVTCDWYME